jgi:hypothetical protein
MTTRRIVVVGGQRGIGQASIGKNTINKQKVTFTFKEVQNKVP